MILPELSLNSALADFVNITKNFYGDNLEKVILFGSYARGDFSPESDVDVMILLSMDDDDIQEHDPILAAYTYDFNDLHRTDIQPISLNYKQYEKWLTVHPFYANVSNEGITLYEKQ